MEAGNEGEDKGKQEGKRELEGDRERARGRKTGGREGKGETLCSIKRNVNPAHTHCEYPRYLQWVGCPFASAAGVELFH